MIIKISEVVEQRKIPSVGERMNDTLVYFNLKNIQFDVCNDFEIHKNVIHSLPKYQQ
jgi:hypothetical protein